MMVTWALVSNRGKKKCLKFYCPTGLPEWHRGHCPGKVGSAPGSCQFLGKGVGCLSVLVVRKGSKNQAGGRSEEVEEYMWQAEGQQKGAVTDRMLVSGSGV